MASGLEKPRLEESTSTLRDGTVVSVRQLRVGDREALERFVDALSEDSIYFRFLASGIDRELLLDQLSPRAGGLTLVAVEGAAIVGHVAYYRSDSEAAEVGALIRDGYQGRGLGTMLIERIARAANAEGVSVFEAIIGWNNTRMIKMVRSMGFPTSEKVEPDVIRIRFPTSIDPVSTSEFQEKWVFGPGC